jgi:hypothetical protein
MVIDSQYDRQLEAALAQSVEASKAEEAKRAEAVSDIHSKQAAMNTNI